MMKKSRFTLTPKNGFFVNKNMMAYFNNGVKNEKKEQGIIHSYYPFEKTEPTGSVSFTFCPDGDTSSIQIRLWSYAVVGQKLCAEFDLETTDNAEPNDFFFSIFKAGDEIKPLSKQTIVGAQRKVLAVQYTPDKNGDAIIFMYATKKNPQSFTFILRKIEVFKL
jgi:hypothetical protein